MKSLWTNYKSSIIQSHNDHYSRDNYKNEISKSRFNNNNQNIKKGNSNNDQKFLLPQGPKGRSNNNSRYQR